MALVHKRKAISSISRYRVCRRSDFSSLAPRTAVPEPEPAIFGIAPSSSLSTQMHSTRKLLPAAAIENSLFGCHRRYRTAGTYLESHHSTTCCFYLRHIFSRASTTTAYPPPAPPKDFQGGDQAAEGDQPPFDDEPNNVTGMGGPEDLNMPPYDDANYPEDDEEYEDEEVPPDPEEKLLYSPSDEN